MGKLNLWSKTTVFNLILAANIFCLFYTVATTSIWQIDPSEFGLASLLPLPFYVGLFLLGCLWYIGLKKQFYLQASFVLTIVYLFVVPTIVRGPVWISNSYYPFGESLIINSTGHLRGLESTTFIDYHYWPLFLYFSSALTIITDIPHEVLLKLFPLISVSMYGLFTFLILKIRLSTQYAAVGGAFFLSCLFIRQQYYGPQSISYLFFLAIFLIAAILFFDEKVKQRGLIGILVILFLITTFMHPLSSFMSIILLLAFFLTNRFVKKESSINLGIFLLIAAIAWLAYNNFVAEPFVNTAVEHISEIISGLRGLNLYGESNRIVGSPAMRFNFMTSWAIVGLAGFIGLLSIIQNVRKFITKRFNVNYEILNVILLILLGLFAFLGEYGDSEGYQRAFMFGLVPLSFLCVSFLSRKPKVLILILAVLMFLNIPAQYGSDTFRLATNSQLSGTKFIADFAPDEVILVGGFSIYLRYHNPFINYTILDVGLRPPFREPPNATAVAEALIEENYIMISRIEDNYNMFYLGFDPYSEIPFKDFNRIYDNGDFILYKP